MSLVKREYDLPIGDLDTFRPDTVYGYIYINGLKKPIYTCREVSKGPDKGMFECVYLKKARKYVKIRLKGSDIQMLATPWRRNNNHKKESKLVKRRESL